MVLGQFDKAVIDLTSGENYKIHADNACLTGKRWSTRISEEISPDKSLSGEILKDGMS